MYNLVLPFPIGQTRTVIDAGLLGQLFSADSKVYQLVKSTGAITAVAGAKSFVQFSAAGAETSLIDAVTGAAETRGAVAGLLDASQTVIASGDYLFVQRKGRGIATTSTTSLAAQVAVATHGVAGEVDDGTVTYATAIAYTTEAQASAQSDVEVIVDLPV